MILSFLPAAPTLWHSAQVTAACAPVSGNLVFLCLAMVNRERCQSATVWQPSPRLSKGAFANWRSCGSLWQSVQVANLTLQIVSRPAGRWHLSHSTFACFPSSGSLELACPVTPICAGFHPSLLSPSAAWPL